MLIAASRRIVDGSGDLELVHSLENRLGTAGLRVREVNTASLKMGWQTALPENYPCSACSPMQAVLTSRDLWSRDRGVDVAFAKQPDNGRVATDRAGLRANSLWDALFATIISNQGRHLGKTQVHLSVPE